MPSAFVVIRSYQIGIKLHILDAWQIHKALMVQIPTETSKTHLLVAVIYDHLEEM